MFTASCALQTQLSSGCGCSSGFKLVVVQAIAVGINENFEIICPPPIYFSALGFRNFKGLEIFRHQALQVSSVFPSERIDKLIDSCHELGEVLEVPVT